MRRPSRRAALGLLGGGAAALLGARWLVPRSQRPGPVRRAADLSPEAQALVRAAFDGVDAARVWDAHAHLVGLGTGGTGTEVDPEMRSHLHPWKRLQFDVYMAASGVRDLARADEEFLERLLALHRAANPAGRLLLLAFDRRVDEGGAEEPGRSPFYVPDERVLAVARLHRDVVPCASVHPYRKDALARLEAAAAGGARAVKWLPNAQGIDPASQRCDAFYARLAALRLVLISHTGVERAVDAAEDQELGNPLRLRRALAQGVRVVAAHCATLGRARDLDRPERGSVPALDLFLRLAREPGTEQLLFGDLSAVTQVNRSAEALRTLLTSEDLHPRLVNGSDYPLPSIDLLISTRLLVHRGLVAAEERAPLDEIFEANALLYDFVLKRRLRVPAGARSSAFAPAVFESARLFA
jgi:uncharacterized protein